MLTVQPQHYDGFLFRVDYPVFRDASLSVVGSLYHRVTLAVVGADDFYYQISTEPEGILIAGIVDIEEQN